MIPHTMLTVYYIANLRNCANDCSDISSDYCLQITLSSKTQP